MTSLGGGGGAERGTQSRKEAGYCISIQGNLFKAQCARPTSFLFAAFNCVLPTVSTQIVFSSHFAQHNTLQTVPRSASITQSPYKQPQTMTHIPYNRMVAMFTGTTGNLGPCMPLYDTYRKKPLQIPQLNKVNSNFNRRK